MYNELNVNLSIKGMKWINHNLTTYRHDEMKHKQKNMYTQGYQWETERLSGPSGYLYLSKRLANLKLVYLKK